MSRSGYSDDCGGWELIRWRGAVQSAIRGERGQAFLREMLAALDEMPEKRLIEDRIVCDDGVCAMGAVAVARGGDVAREARFIGDESDRELVAQLFGIAPALAAEIAYKNDDRRKFDGGKWRDETPEERFTRMRAWVVEHIRTDTAEYDAEHAGEACGEGCA